VTVSSWLNFGRPAPPGRESAAGENFCLRLTTASAQCLRISERYFHSRLFFSPNSVTKFRRLHPERRNARGLGKTCVYRQNLGNGTTETRSGEWGSLIRSHGYPMERAHFRWSWVTLKAMAKIAWGRSSQRLDRPNLAWEPRGVVLIVSHPPKRKGVGLGAPRFFFWETTFCADTYTNADAGTNGHCHELSWNLLHVLSFFADVLKFF